MSNKILAVIAAASFAFSSGLLAAEQVTDQARKAKPVKEPRVVETRLSEHDIGRIEHAINRAVVAKQGTGSWEYTARKMKPPKNDKWEKIWNDMGAEGWEAVDHFENVYIFKRPAILGSLNPAPAVQPTTEELKKEDKAKEDAIKEEDRQKEKAAKEAEKAAKKAQKEAEKAAKKAQKEADRAAMETAEGGR